MRIGNYIVLWRIKLFYSNRKWRYRRL
jgi:hypothetical protein